MKNLIPFTLVAGLLFAACTDESDINPAAHMSVEEPAQVVAQQVLHTNFYGDIARFETADATTRASTTTTSWENGDTLYIQYSTASSTVDGIAVYKDGEWDGSNIHGNISEGAVAACRIYYFKGLGQKTLSDLALTARTAVFADTLATYILEEGVLTLTAHLKPLTGRLRFKGTSGQKVTFSGLKWYDNLPLQGNLHQAIGTLTLTAGNDGYTPYIYGSFEDNEERVFTVPYDMDLEFVRSFGMKVLATGKSGHIDIPTMENCPGWTIVKRYREFTVSGHGKDVTFKMRRVLPGTFWMGKAGADDIATPVHSVTLTKTYYMAECEVTQALWYAVTGQKPISGTSIQWTSQYGLGDNFPAYYISYDDVTSFLKTLNSMVASQLQSGEAFRFPSEAEWEFAAKGGRMTQNYTYSGSNTLNNVAWFTDNSNSTSHTAKGKTPNELGLYDMSGNVWEWCADVYGAYTSAAQTDPTRPTSGYARRVYRGGSWYAEAAHCCVAFRSSDYPTNDYRIGFRLAL